MATAVLTPLSAIHQNDKILPASALAQHVPRHGRSRGMSVKGKGTRNRGYSLAENADVTTAKAISFLLKRAIKADDVEDNEDDDDDEGEEEEREVEENRRLVADADDWISVSDLLQHPNMEELDVDLKRVLQAAASLRARFTVRQLPNSNETDPASYQVQQMGKRSSTQAPVPKGSALSLGSDELPEYAVFETTYQAYPLILAFGGIKRADGATLTPYAVQKSISRASDADVSIWIHLRTAMEKAPKISWQYTTTGSLVTADDVPKHLWTKVVGRRADVGVLFEDGQVRKEVPEFLRGKGGKGKARKGKGLMKMGPRDASASDSEE